MAALPSVVLPCVDDAVGRCALIVDRAAVFAADSLEQELRRRDSTAERQELGIALRELLRLRLAWRSRFPQVLRTAIENALTGAVRPRLAVRPSSLQLVDDGELMQSIETSRLAQELGAKVERPLADHDALMSSALGLEGVHPESNPLRPDVFAQALRTLMGEDQPQPGWPALWMRHMAEPLADDLGQLYAASSRLLLEASVQAAGYRVVTAPAPLQALGSRPAPLAAASAPASLAQPTPIGSAFAQAISSFMQFASHALHGPFVREFLTRDAPQVHQSLPRAYYSQLEQELASLQGHWDEAPHEPAADREFEPLAPVERPMRAIATDSPLTRDNWGRYGAPRQRALVRTQLKTQAHEVGEDIGVELVRQLLDQVAQDPRLLAPVREAMVALEPALGRLALKAPRFAGEVEHPARRLLEAVTTRSLRYNDEFSSEFQDFFGSVREQFNELNQLETLADAEPFEQALEQLEAGWQQQDRHEQAHQQALVAAVQGAERRQAEADQIAWEFSQRSDLAGVPAVVQDFLFTRWAMVVAQARISCEGREVDPGGYVAVISDLLWSVKRDCTLREPARAFELIPRVVVKLRGGLELIGEPPGEHDPFFKALERLHRPVLKLRARHRRQTMESVTELPPEEDLAPAPPQAPQPAGQPWLAPGELQACGFEDTLPSDFAQLLPAEGPQGAAPDITMASADAQLAHLVEGCWVDLFSRQRWRRARLTWTNSQGTLFMFVSHGNRPHSMTRRSLQRLLCNRLLRPVAGHEVVQHAIDSLARPPTRALAA